MADIDIDDVEGKVFIGGLSWQTTEATLRSYFQKFGELTDVALMVDKHTGQPRGFGFIKMKHAPAAEFVVGQEHVIDGRKVDAKRAVPREKVSIPIRAELKKIFVGGLSSDVTNEIFAEYFSTFGTIKDAVVMLDRTTGRSRGFGFITFESHDSVKEVLKLENRNQIMGKGVEVKLAEPREPNPRNNRHNNMQPMPHYSHALPLPMSPHHLHQQFQFQQQFHQQHQQQQQQLILQQLQMLPPHPSMFTPTNPTTNPTPPSPSPASSSSSPPDQTSALQEQLASLDINTSPERDINTPPGGAKGISPKMPFQGGLRTYSYPHNHSGHTGTIEHSSVEGGSSYAGTIYNVIPGADGTNYIGGPLPSPVYPYGFGSSELASQSGISYSVPQMEGAGSVPAQPPNPNDSSNSSSSSPNSINSSPALPPPPPPSSTTPTSPSSNLPIQMGMNMPMGMGVPLPWGVGIAMHPQYQYHPQSQGPPPPPPPPPTSMSSSSPLTQHADPSGSSPTQPHRSSHPIQVHGGPRGVFHPQQQQQNPYSPSASAYGLQHFHYQQNPYDMSGGGNPYVYPYPYPYRYPAPQNYPYPYPYSSSTVPPPPLPTAASTSSQAPSPSPSTNPSTPPPPPPLNATGAILISNSSSNPPLDPSANTPPTSRPAYQGQGQGYRQGQIGGTSHSYSKKNSPRPVNVISYVD